MRGKKAKELKRTFRDKTNEVLILIRNEYGEATKYMTESIMFNRFRQMYKRGKIRHDLLVRKNKRKGE